MKKTIILLSLLITISVPAISYPQNDPIDIKLQKLSSEIYEIELILANIFDDFTTTVKSCRPCSWQELCAITLSREYVRRARIECGFIRLLLPMLSYMKEEYKPHYYNQTKHVIETSKNRTKGALRSLRQRYNDIKNKAALNLSDKAKAPIDSAIALYDKSIEIMNHLERQR